jgi:protein-tyrosine phosphatase
MKCYTQLTDGLFLGNQFSTTIITDINVIISIGCKSKSTIPSIVNYKVSIRDSVDSVLTPLFGDVTAFIHSNLLNNKKVLVH